MRRIDQAAWTSVSAAAIGSEMHRRTSLAGSYRSPVTFISRHRSKD